MSRSTAAEQKKAEERQFLDALTTIYPGFPRGRVEPTEEPDFLVREPGRTTGVEIVKYVRGQGIEGGSPQREEEAFRGTVAQAAQREYDSQAGPPILATLVWNSHPPRGLSVQELAISMVDLVIPRVLADHRGTGSIEWEDLQGSPLEAALAKIYIDRRVSGRASTWFSTSGGAIGVGLDEIEEVLAAKGAKVEAYLKKCDAVWLVVVSGYFMPHEYPISGEASPSEDLLEHVFTTGFERVIFYHHSERRAFDLRVQSG